MEPEWAKSNKNMTGSVHARLCSNTMDSIWQLSKIGKIRPDFEIPMVSKAESQQAKLFNGRLEPSTEKSSKGRDSPQQDKPANSTRKPIQMRCCKESKKSKATASRTKAALPGREEDWKGGESSRCA